MCVCMCMRVSIYRVYLENLTFLHSFYTAILSKPRNTFCILSIYKLYLGHYVSFLYITPFNDATATTCSYCK